MQKVTDLIDIEASCEQVFAIIVDNARRMQLNPLWGGSELLEVSPDFPHSGSRYRVRLTSGAHFTARQEQKDVTRNALREFAQLLSVKWNQPDFKPRDLLPEEGREVPHHQRQSRAPVIQEYCVMAYEPPHLFRYSLLPDNKTIVTWRCEGIPLGTRLRYEEEFSKEIVQENDFLPTLRQVIHEWLANIKRYSELIDGRGRLIRWVVDHFYLKLRPDQRRVMVVLGFMQAVGLISFILALLLWGLVSLLSWLYSAGS
ncbi:MAG: hypothetical protein Fur0043_16250 [Anaerolineales bacterium]